MSKYTHGNSARAAVKIERSQSVTEFDCTPEKKKWRNALRGESQGNGTRNVFFSRRTGFEHR